MKKSSGIGGVVHLLSLVALLETFCQLTTVANGWLLAQLGLNESYRVRHLSTHFSRVFLSIEVEGNKFPTFIEAQWPVSYLPMRTSVFPHANIHANGVHEDCTRLQQAHWSQVDSLSRLWVMDLGWLNKNGTQMCPPKLLVFDLIRNNVEVLRIDCGRQVQANTSQGLVVRLGPKLRCCEIERHIYFIQPNRSHILTYDILEQTWQRKQLLCNKYEDVARNIPITPVDFTFGLKGELLICDSDGALYSSMDKLLPEKGNEIPSDTIQLNTLGNLLGPSRGLMSDHLGAIFYVVPKFGSVVRCSQIGNLTTEGNEVIYMTSKNIQQIFFGAEGSVWVLTDRLLKPNDMCFPGLL